MKSTIYILRLSGKACQVWRQLDAYVAKLGNLTLAQLAAKGAS